MNSMPILQDGQVIMNNMPILQEIQVIMNNMPILQEVQVIINNMPILQEDEKMRNILSKHKILKSKRQPFNLKRLLMKAKFTSNDIYEVKKCSRPNFGLCTHLLEGNSLYLIAGWISKYMKTCHVKLKTWYMWWSATAVGMNT